MLFVTVIIGVILLAVIADNTAEISQTVVVVNETVSGVNMGVAETLANDDLVSFTTLWNTTGDAIPATNYTVVLSTGVLTVNTNDVLVNGSDLKATYTYYVDNYVHDSTSRSLIALITILFALGIFGICVYLLLNKLMGDIM